MIPRMRVHAHLFRCSGRGWRTYSQATSQLPQTTDLLQVYHGLVSLGKIQHDEAQVRVVMHLRRISKDLENYAPPALTSRYFTRHTPRTPISAEEGLQKPWWQADNSAAAEVDANVKALIRAPSHENELAQLTTPKGLLLTGRPGSGKSFLIDLWLGTLSTPFKARKHYSELVLEIYRAVWEETKLRMAAEHARKPEDTSYKVPWNAALRDNWISLLSSGLLPKKWTRRADMGFTSESSSSLQPTIAFVIAQRLLLRHWLLVFDEVQLLDVSSATLLADVLSWYWRMGGILVGTSNKVPEDLYKNGVQRERLEPFVEALKQRCPVASLSSGKDWREIRAKNVPNSEWYVYGQEGPYERRLLELSDSWSEEVHSVFGRSLRVPRASQSVCHFTFDELCEESLGSADYLTLAAKYRTFAISCIPGLTLSAKNQARRFISLIDALYEARCRLVCLAETPPELLFFAEGSKATIDDTDVMLAETVGETREVYRPNVASYDTLDMAEAPAAPMSTVPLEQLSLFSGKDEQFAFKRALSRLREMTSEAYWREEQWTPLPPSARKWEGCLEEEVGVALPLLPSVPPRGSCPTCGEKSPSVAVVDNAERSDVRPDAPRVREKHFWGMGEK